MHIDYHLDLRGESCPYPAIKVIEALQELNKGEVLQAVCDCRQTLQSIPFDVKHYGSEILEIVEDKGEIIFTICKA